MIYDVYISDAESIGNIYDEGTLTFHFNELDGDTAEILAESAMKDGYLVAMVPQLGG